MELTQEERQQIYEEEKARLETERSQDITPEVTGTGLQSNIAGLLCYVAGWITGIIFLIIEQKDNFVRFHALQSIIAFGTLSLAGIILSKIPFVGTIFSIILWILMFVLWIVLMVKAYQGEWYKIPVAGDIADKAFKTREAINETDLDQVEDKQTTEQKVSDDASYDKQIGKLEQRMDSYFTDAKSARITASSLAIALSLVLLVFFSFFHSYIAVYEQSGVGNATIWNRTPLLTGDYFEWLPILVITLILSIAGHIVLIKYDRYWLRQVILIVLNVLGIVVVVNLFTIFPFNFSAIPDANVANIISVVIRIALIGIAIGLGIGSLVMLIKLIVNYVKETS